MPRMAVFDACVLYSNAIRDFMMWSAVEDIVQPRWSDTILNECFHALGKRNPPDKLMRTRTLMNEALPDAMVTGYQPLIPTLHLPDPNDRHVLAAAITCEAKEIVTFDLRHFPDSTLQQHRMEVRHPDAFFLSVIDANPNEALAALTAQAAGLKRSPNTPEAVIASLHKSKLVHSAELLGRLLREAQSV